MKLPPVTKRNKRKKKTSKKCSDDLILENCYGIVFFQFMVNLEQSGNQIPKAESVKLIFSLIVTVYLTKTENRTKNSQTQLSHYCFE